MLGKISDLWISVLNEEQKSALHEKPWTCRVITNLMFASSLLILFSSSSLALAFLRSAMNCTRPRMFELLLELPRPRKLPAEDAIVAIFQSAFWIELCALAVGEQIKTMIQRAPTTNCRSSSSVSTYRSFHGLRGCVGSSLVLFEMRCWLRKLSLVRDPPSAKYYGVFAPFLQDIKHRDIGGWWIPGEIGI